MEFKPGHTVGIDLGTTFSTHRPCSTSRAIRFPRQRRRRGRNPQPDPAGRQRARGRRPQPHAGRHGRSADTSSSASSGTWATPSYKRTFDGREITPEFLSALILKKLRQDAEKQIGKIGNAVITVPALLQRRPPQGHRRRRPDRRPERDRHHQRADRRHADLRLASGRAGRRRAGGERPHQALVYDLGGGTFDVTVVRYTPTHFQVLATDGDVQLGGVDWNDRLLDYVAKEFQARHHLDPRLSPAALQMLRHDCDQAKIALSERTEDDVTCRHEGKCSGHRSRANSSRR